ncbi:thrombopoietin receptor isoform X1 [Hippocampus comes]|uniref:thrombopoietin receptor isoform X1 n=1 Tax=Hippocampus comes TaxID=109280 RepID=UPI00094F1550|nr:PREDICTED: thrombopoietin receptor isoform X1 [Hippocampus comes]
MTTNTYKHVLVLLEGGGLFKLPPYIMKLTNMRNVLFGMWMQLLCVLWICSKYVTGIHLSQDDIYLLREEDDPKCFTRTEEDFTCFFETPDNGTYNLLYYIGESGERRCELLTQRTKEGAWLHICSFPDKDVVIFVDIHLQVVECNNNTRIYSRNVSVEDHILLDAPFNVLLHHNGKPGQMLVSCLTNVPKYWEDKLQYRMRYISKGIGERTKERIDKLDDSLVSLVPGEEVQVQVAVKCANIESAGHWSHWSDPVRDVVPQSADDISLMCDTSDLQTITCRWNSSRYGKSSACKLFNKMHLSETLGWTDWIECVNDRNLTDQCSFQGDKSIKVQVKLSTAAFPLSRTFYTKEFTLRNIIKTKPPTHLRGLLEKEKLCLMWEAPLMALSSHLQYEVGCQIRESKGWLLTSPKGPATGTCLEVPPNIRYRVKIRTKPNGSFYSGHWSEWSNLLTGKTPADIDSLLMTCIPATLLVAVVILISLGFTYFRKLKQCFWPPVPNLDKVLQGFLTEINLQKWDPPVPAKQYFEDVTSSIVEVMSQDEVSGLGKAYQESTQCLSSEQGHHTGDQEEGHPRTELKLYPDYVTLNRESLIICSTGNKYVYEQLGEMRGPGVEGELLPNTCHRFCVSDCLDTNFLNHSYVPFSKPAARAHDKDTGQRGPGNLYTNLACR